MIDEERLLERFCRYARRETTSNRHAGTIPSTEAQREFAQALAEELRGLSPRSVEIDEHAFVIARFEAAPPYIGLMAHMDTSADAPGAGVRPIVHRGYDGAAIRLSGGLTLDPAEYPELAGRVGDTIVTSDGTTLLGADDKAGIAAVITALEHITAHPEIPRCSLEVIFTPDEETGLGMSLFPLSRLKSRVCYTVDGGEEGTIEAECFEAYRVKVVFVGKSIHLGTARGKLVNAVEMAGSFLALLPRSESPEAVDGRYGYYCPLEIRGALEEAELEVFIRDFEEHECRRRIEALRAMAAAVQEAYPGGTVRIEPEKQYSNMKRRLDEHPRVLELLRKAISLSGLTPVEKAIRGGTDGSRLTEMGVPTPNLFTGAHNFHSRLEWVSLSGMVRAAETIVHLAGLWASAGSEGETR